MLEQSRNRNGYLHLEQKDLRILVWTVPEFSKPCERRDGIRALADSHRPGGHGFALRLVCLAHLRDRV